MVIIYSTSWCPSCISAKRLLDSKEIKYEEINIEEVDISREELIKIAGAATVPQIMINVCIFIGVRGSLERDI